MLLTNTVKAAEALTAPASEAAHGS
jgi:hypothetical protein